MKASDYALYNTKTRQREVLDDDLVSNAVLGGTHSFAADARVPVVDPDGRRGSLGAGELRAAIKDGFRVIGPKELAISEYLTENDNLGGAAKVFFGQALDEFALGLPELVADYSQDPFEAAKREALKKQNELSSVLGAGTGMIGSAIFGPAKVAELGARGIMAAGKKAIAARMTGAAAGAAGAEKVAAGVLQRLGGRTVDGIAEGALLSMPHAITESAFGDHEAAAESMLFGTMAGGVFGAGAGITKELIDTARSGSSRFYSWAEGRPLTGAEVSKKAARIMTGVPEEHIAHIADDANLERMIRRKPEGGYDVLVPERENIRDEAESVLMKVIENNDQAQQSYTQILADTNTALKRELDDIARGSAPEGVIQKVTGELDRIKEASGTIRVHYDNTLKDMQDMIMSGADAETVKKIPYYVPQQTITKMLNTLERSLGTESATLGKTAYSASPQKIAAQRRLGDVRDVVQKYFGDVAEGVGKEVQPGMDLLFARNIVRDLDDIANYGLAAGEFDSAVSATVKAAQHELRHAVRGKLTALQHKNLDTLLDPMSAQTVKQLAKQAEKLWDLQIQKAEVIDQAKGFFQNPQRTANALDAMTGKNFRASEIGRALAAVERETGESILPLLDDWMHRKGLLRDSKLSPQELARVRAELLPGPAEALETARLRAEAAAAELLPFKGWSGRRIETVVNKTEWKNASIEDGRKLEALGQLRDKYFGTPDNPDYKPRNFAQEAKDRAVWDSFDQARPNGSRKALMGGTLGTALFSIFGPAAAAFGGALGAGAGGAMDYYGGKMLRDFLINGNNYRSLLFVEAQMKKAAKKLDGISGAVDSFATRKGDPVSRVVRTSGIQAVLGIKGDFTDRRAHWEKIQEKIAELSADPGRMISLSADLSGAISHNGAPSIGGKFNQKLMKTLQYILDETPKAPRGPSPFAPKTQWRPTDYELKLFDDKLEVLADPFAVIDRMKDRTISSGHVSALRENYPRIYEEIKYRTSERLMESKTPVDRGDRIKLSLLFGAEWDHGLSDEGILASQSVYAPKEPAQAQQGGQAINVNIAGQYANSRSARQMLDA